MAKCARKLKGLFSCHYECPNSWCQAELLRLLSVPEDFVREAVLRWQADRCLLPKLWVRWLVRYSLLWG